MSNAENIQPFVESREPTTVLDAYEAVMSLGEEAVSKLAMQVWNGLPPPEREMLRLTARETYPDLEHSALYAEQLLIFDYVNRTRSESPKPTQENVYDRLT